MRCDIKEFVAAVSKRLETGLPADQTAARQRLVQESWAAKAQQFEHWVFGPASARL
jgi:hypothetical protein